VADEAAWAVVAVAIDAAAQAVHDAAVAAAAVAVVIAAAIDAINNYRFNHNLGIPFV
jgi:hypothetical protein